VHSQCTPLMSNVCLVVFGNGPTPHGSGSELVRLVHDMYPFSSYN
jgi:hypothetical protein